MFCFFVYVYWLTVIVFGIHTNPACFNLFSIFIEWYESNDSLWYPNVCCIQSKSLKRRIYERRKCAAWCEIRFICRFYRLNKNIEYEKCPTITLHYVNKVRWYIFNVHVSIIQKKREREKYWAFRLYDNDFITIIIRLDMCMCSVKCQQDHTHLWRDQIISA